MPPIAELTPILKPADWPGRDEGPWEPLLELETTEPIPGVALGWDTPTHLVFARTRDLVALGASVDDARRAAAANVARAKVGRTDIPVSAPDGGELRILTFGGPLAAEKILDPVFLRDLQRELGARLLAVGAPRRGMLLVVDGGLPPRRLLGFSAVVQGQFERAESPPICPTVFAVDDGQVIGLLASAPPERHGLRALVGLGVLVAVGVGAMALAVAIGPTESSTRLSPAVTEAVLRSLEGDPLSFLPKGTVTREDREVEPGRIELHLWGDGPDYAQVQSVTLANGLGYVSGEQPLPSGFDGVVRMHLPKVYDTPENARDLAETVQVFQQLFAEHPERTHGTRFTLDFGDPPGR